MHGLSIGKLSKAAKVSIYTIRFYEKTGLLPPAARRPSGFREYSEADVLLLRFVRDARSFGFTLEQIADLLALADAHGSAGTRVMVSRRLKTIEQKIARLQGWRDVLQHLSEPAGAERSKREFLQRFFREEPAVEARTASMTAAGHEVKDVDE